MRKLSSPRSATLSIQLFAVLILGFFLAAANAQQEDPNVTVHMIDAQGNSVGTVEVKQLAKGTLFVADLKNLPPGGHGFHVHQHGKCQPTFEAAGGHYSPLKNKHGFDNKQGFHAGDMPNIHVTEEGTAQASFFVRRLVLGFSPDASAGSERTPEIAPTPPASPEEGPFPLLDEDRSAIIIHRDPDDYEAMPPGSTGPRIACGVIQASKQSSN